MDKSVPQSSMASDLPNRPLPGMPGHFVGFNDRPGFAGVEVVTPDHQVISFGGRPAVEAYIEQRRIPAEAADVLRRIDAQADPYRDAPQYPEIPPTNHRFGRDLAQRVYSDHQAQSQEVGEAHAERSIQLRASLHETAILAAKQSELHQGLPKTVEGQPNGRSADVLPPEVAATWAEVDARDYSRITTQERRTDAAATMAESMQLNRHYADALRNHSPATAQDVERLAGVESVKVAAKESAKASEFHVSASDASNDPFLPKGTEEGAFKEKVNLSAALALNQPEALKEVKLKNQVESDEVFTATNSSAKAVPADVQQRYVRVGDKYFHPRNTESPVFEDKGNKLETGSDSGQVASALVAIARARGWDEVKVSGSEAFRKEAWLEAAALGMQVKGYTPTEQDRVELAKRSRDAVQSEGSQRDGFRASEIQPALTRPPAKAFASEPPEKAIQSHPELAGAIAAQASIQKKAEADQLTPQQQAMVMDRVRRNIVNSIERGELPQVAIKEEMRMERIKTEEREVSR